MIHSLRDARRQEHWVSRCCILTASRERKRPTLASVSIWRLMSIQDLSGRQKADGTQRTVRSLRLTTGLILFGYATSHFLNHAFGVRSIESMQAASTILLRPWQSYPGLLALYGSFLVHGLLGLYALHRRRHLRMPAAEAWQLALGLIIPLLLIPHAATLRLGQSIYGIEFGYERVLYAFWVASPDIALPRQIL